MPKHPRCLAVTRSLVLAGLSLVAATATAQEPPAPEQAALQEVVVTGSRIAQPNLTSTSPIQVQGNNNIIDLMNNLPQNFQNAATDFSSTTNPLTAAGGISTADLRGLGPQRTLVLLDGRRLGAGD